MQGRPWARVGRTLTGSPTERMQELVHGHDLGLHRRARGDEHDRRRDSVWLTPTLSAHRNRSRCDRAVVVDEKLLERRSVGGREQRVGDPVGTTRLRLQRGFRIGEPQKADVGLATARCRDDVEPRLAFGVLRTPPRRDLLDVVADERRPGGAPIGRVGGNGIDGANRAPRRQPERGLRRKRQGTSRTRRAPHRSQDRPPGRV